MGNVSPQIQSVRTWRSPLGTVERQFQFDVKRYDVWDLLETGFLPQERGMSQGIYNQDLK